MFSKVTCEVCREKPATIFITRVENGQQKQQHLCESCAQGQTGGTDWLQAMARKFDLPDDATLEEVMQSIADKLPLGLDPQTGMLTSDAGELEGLDLEGRTFGPPAARRPHHTRRTGEETYRRSLRPVD